MAAHANSTPVPIAQTIPLMTLSSLATYARAACVAVDTDEQVNALLDIEAGIWREFVARPVTKAGEAQIKLTALLRDLHDRDEASPDVAMILTQVVMWLNGVRGQ